MADKAISELTAAEQVTPTDLFVLDQDGVAKKLTGQILKEWLRSIFKEDNDTLNGIYAAINERVRTVNNIPPDINGNVEVAGGGGGASVDEVLDAIPTVTDVAVTENADGSVTMVNTLSDGSAETIVVTADENGNPNGLSVNGIAIPVTWNEVLT